MATIPIPIPDAAVTRVQDAFAAQFNYMPTVIVDGVEAPNPETKQAFTQRMIRDYVKTVTASHEAAVASKTAGDAARDLIG